MRLKGLVEGGAVSVVAGCSMHPLDLIKVRMQLNREVPTPAMRFALVFPFPQHHHHTDLLQPARKPGPIAMGDRAAAGGLLLHVHGTLRLDQEEVGARLRQRPAAAAAEDRGRARRRRLRLHRGQTDSMLQLHFNPAAKFL